MPEIKPKILITDDERSIRKFLLASLSAAYTIIEAEDGSQAIQLAAAENPDLILLDLGLPDMDGVEVTRRIREWSKTPIIVISVRDDEQGKIDALDAGADDYVTKPFGAGELMARIRVALRRVGTADEPLPLFESGALKVNLTLRQVHNREELVQLTPTEYDLLKLFILHQGKVLTHRHILFTVWGAGYESDIHVLQVNISNLRRKIEPDPSRPTFITTEPGIGYRFHAANS